MNLILFEASETRTPLRRTDPRAIHLLEVLRRQRGDTFDAGLIDGALGKGTVLNISDREIELSFGWLREPPPLDPLTLLVGLPRPQTARKLLQEITALGINRFDFVRTERAEASYASSTLWTSGEWRRHLIAGAEQAFCTRLPLVSHGRSLSEVIQEIPPNVTRLALDNYESTTPLHEFAFTGGPVVLALGAERGWAPMERGLLREHRFHFAHLGRRVLRVETAAIAAIAIAKARSGFV